MAQPKNSGIRTKEEKAYTLAVLYSNDGNIKRTARETGVHESTIRDWRNKQEKNPDPVIEELMRDAGNDIIIKGNKIIGLSQTILIHSMETIWKEIREGTRSLSPADAVKLSTVGAIWTDKVVRAQGKPTSINEDRKTLDPKSAETALELYLPKMFEQATIRQRELEKADKPDTTDADVVDDVAVSEQSP